MLSDDKLSVAELEHLALRIDPLHRADEASLIRTRWHDYAFMHPVTATMEYSRLYHEQIRSFMERCVDLGAAAAMETPDPEEVFGSRDLTCFWLARAAADGLGVPYGTALRFAQDRFLERGFRVFPRPNQLYGEEFEIDLKAHWQLTLAQGVRYSSHPHLKAEAGRSPERDRHVGFLIEQIKQRPLAPPRGILGRLFHEGVLDANLVWGAFDDAEIEAAQRIAAQLGNQSPLTSTL